MVLAKRFDQDVEQLVIASTRDSGDIVRQIVLDPSIADFEAIFLVAAACCRLETRCEYLAYQIAGGTILDAFAFFPERESLLRQMRVHGDVVGVVKALGSMPRERACCMSAMICDWYPEAAKLLCQQMERLHDDPELLGQLG